MELIRKNSKGEKVVDLQRRLRLLGHNLGNYDIDGLFGEETENAVRQFQQDRGIFVTGVVNQVTWQELVDAGYKIGDRLLYLKNPPFRGDDVKVLQSWLKTLGFYRKNENGIFCKSTHEALVEFQKDMNISDDGILGERSVQYLKNLKRIIIQKETSDFPAAADSTNNNEKEMIILLDYGFDKNRIDEYADYYRENLYSCKGIINFCKDLLNSKGIGTFITIDEDDSQSLFMSDRINIANKGNADILISINMNYSSEPDASGSSCFYFKGLKSHSRKGKKLANLIQDELVDQLGSMDCRTHGAGYSILKDTVMTSVLIEPAFISNEDERKKIKNTLYQQKISKGIVKAIIRFIKS